MMEQQNIQSNIYKKLFFGLLFMVTIGIVSFAAYLIGKNQLSISSNSSGVISQPPAQQTTPSQAPSGDMNIVPITANTISFARIEGKVYLRYRGKIYNDSNQLEPQVVTPLNSENVMWYGLIDAPADVSPGEFMSDEVFGFKEAPGGKSFAFIMRWAPKDSSSPHTTYNLFYYNQVNTPRLVLLRKTVQPSFEEPSPVFKIDNFSPDGQYISLRQYGCWNCGAGPGTLLLVRLQDKQTKDIGPTSYFSWKNNGAYDYKEVVLITCPPTPTAGEFMTVECMEKPENLPLKTAQF